MAKGRLLFESLFIGQYFAVCLDAATAAAAAVFVWNRYQLFA